MKEETKSIYVAGPMRGYPGFNYNAFDEAAEKLRSEGWTVYNPTEISAHYGTPDDLISDECLLRWIMDEEIKLIKGCADAIYLLKGWEKSEGAKEELATYLSTGRREIFVQ